MGQRLRQRAGSLAEWRRAFLTPSTTSRRASPTTTTSPTRVSRRRSSSRCGSERPLLLEGEAGVGKTEVAKVLARWTGGELVRLQCYEGIDASQAVYEWDYSRQLLHLRAVEASHERVDEDELYSERFLVKRPLLRALAHDGAVPPVLLIDEVDRADDEFEAFLLEILSDWSITVPELGPVARVGAADRRAHVEPHPRRARRAEAPLPVSLDRASRLRT